MLRLRSLIAPALAAALVPTSLLAQDSCYHPADGALVSIRVSDLASWQAAFDRSALWQLCQLPDIREAIGLARERFDERSKVLVDLYGVLVDEAGKDDQDGVMEKLRSLEELRWEDINLWIYDVDDEPAMVIAFRAPDGQGEKLGELIEFLMELDAEQGAVEVEDTGPEIGGQKARRFAAKQEQDAGAAPEVWYWHRAGLTLFGVGADVPIGTLAETPAPRVAADEQLLGDNAGFFVNVDVAGFVARENAAQDDPARAARALARMKAVGVDAIRSVAFAFGFDGGQVRESMFVETDGELGGLLGAWVNATAPLPAHPQLDDAMLQLGFSLDLQRLQGAVAAIREADADVGEEPAAPSELEQLLPELARALTGGMSLQVSGPAVGGFVPKMSMALGVADRQALDALIASAREKFAELTFEERETDGVAWTCVKIPNSPSSLVPSFAFLGDTLVLAESPATIRETIRAHADGARAMAVDGAPPATPLGDPDPAFDGRFDGHAIWRVMQERYVPMVKLLLSQAMMSGGPRFTPLLEAREVPDLEPIGEGLGLGRGGLKRTADGFVVSGAGTFGDPMTTALMAVYTPLLPTAGGMIMDAAVGEAQGDVGRARLQRVWQAMSTYRTSFGNGSSLPRELGDLFARGLLESEQALLVPGATEPSTVEYEDLDGEIQEVGSSFRYSPDGKLKITQRQLSEYAATDASNPFVFRIFVGEEDTSEEFAILLYEQRPHARGHRLVLTADGKIYSLSEEGAKIVLGQ